MKALNELLYLPGVKQILGFSANYGVYFLVEALARRRVSWYSRDLERFFKLPYSAQVAVQNDRLANTLEYAFSEVPYYSDLKVRHGLDVDKVRKDAQYIQDIPCLTKDIIRDQGDRLISKNASGQRRIESKTGGSTGPSCSIFYDPVAADRSAAVTRFFRKSIGKKWDRSEVHFAAYFGDESQLQWIQKETLKCMAMNRSNVFVSELTSDKMQEILRTLRTRRPYLVHAHPSTLYQIAVHAKGTLDPVFPLNVIEPSGETCPQYIRDLLVETFGARVHDRYGLAEFGVVAYQLDSRDRKLRVCNADFFVEARKFDEGMNELTITGFANRLMPLIRYRTGDLTNGIVEEEGLFIDGVQGRVHDRLTIGDREMFTHYIQDIVDHRIGCICEFQIVASQQGVNFLIQEQDVSQRYYIEQQLRSFFPGIHSVKFVASDGFIRTGVNQKFRHLVQR